MNPKEPKPQPPVDSLQLIIKKIRQKGPDFLQKQEMAVCLTTVGFSDVCKKLSIPWNQNIQKQFKEKLKKLEFDIDWIDRKTPAELAPFLVHCERGDIEKIKEFIKKTPQESRKGLVEAVDASKKSALHVAAQGGYDALVDYLIAEKFKVNGRDKQLKTPLHKACEGSHENVVHSLITNGADVYAKDFKYNICQLRGETPLHIVVRTGNSKIATELLDKIPRLVDGKDFTGKTALHYAVVSLTEGQVDVVRLLIERGANVDEVDFDGRTPLHYACQYGKTRCIPILLKHKANLNIKDFAKKTALDLASNDKVKKIIEAYSNEKLIIGQGEEKDFRKQFGDTIGKDLRISRNEGSKIFKNNNQSKIQDGNKLHQTQQQLKYNNNSNNLLLGGDTNQVSTWIRQKFFVLMKKLQESGVKIRYHLKKPYMYTASWMEEIDNIEQLFLIFRELTGPEVALRVFNILCPYEKKLPTGVSTIDAVQGFFGETWFSQSTTDKSRKPGKTQTKIQKQLEQKEKELEQYKIANIGYQSQLERLQSKLTELNQELKQYKKIEDDIRKQRVKNAKQYSQILKLTNQVQDLKKQLKDYESGHDINLSYQQKITQLTKKNQQLIVQITALKSYQAAARRKCGKIFLKSIHNPIQISQQTMNNLYDDDSIIHLYQLLHNNPPNLHKRLLKASKTGRLDLTVSQFNTFLQDLSMLPQDIMSLNRIVGFINGRKLLPIQQFKNILKNRPQVRVEWERKLLGKIKMIIKNSEVGSVEKLFELLDKDGSGSLEIGELREGLEEYNIYINQNDVLNLFSLIDGDRSGCVDLEELRVMLEQGVSAKKLPSEEEFNEQAKEEQEKEGEVEEEGEKEKEKENEEEDQNNQKENQDQNNNENQQPQSQNQSHPSKPTSKQPSQISYNQLYKDSPQKNYSVTSQDLRDTNFLKSLQQDTSPLISGKCKIQIPFCKQILSQQTRNNVVIKIECYGNEIVKIGDFRKTKWEIAIEFIIENRMSWATPIRISLWGERVYDEEHFLGMVEIPFEEVYGKPNQWGVNRGIRLEGGKWGKEVTGEIGVQAKWIPGEPKEKVKQEEKEEEGENEKEQQEGEGNQEKKQENEYQQNQEEGTPRQNNQDQEPQQQQYQQDQNNQPPPKDNEDQNHNEQFDQS